jgi:hypothetical protein
MMEDDDEISMITAADVEEQVRAAVEEEAAKVASGEAPEFAPLSAQQMAGKQEYMRIGVCVCVRVCVCVCVCVSMCVFVCARAPASAKDVHTMCLIGCPPNRYTPLKNQWMELYVLMHTLTTLSCMTTISLRRLHYLPSNLAAITATANSAPASQVHTHRGAHGASDSLQPAQAVY